ncbi:MAG: hypothetical protein HRF43_16895 [Phycisphaerae bacterium]
MPDDDPKIADELRRMAYEPLLPAEKKLIAASLALGVVLLIAFIVLTRLFAPGRPQGRAGPLPAPPCAGQGLSAANMIQSEAFASAGRLDALEALTHPVEVG